MIYALREALRLVQEEGLETRWARHRRNQLALKAGLAGLGIGYATVEGHNVLLFLAALEQCLAAQGVKITPGAGGAAANRVSTGR